MSWHKNPEINNALIRLMDELVTWERETGRGSTLVFVPHYPDDGAELKVLDGKPIQNEFIVPFELVLNASAKRLKNEESLDKHRKRKS